MEKSEAVIFDGNGDRAIVSSGSDIPDGVELPDRILIRGDRRRVKSMFKALDNWICQKDGGKRSFEVPAPLREIVLDIQDPFNVEDIAPFYNLGAEAVSLMENDGLKTVDGILYSRNGKTLIKCPYRRHGSVRIAEGTEIISEDAFISSCVEKVEFPETVWMIDEWAFGGCTKLRSVKLNEGLLEIESNAFSSDKNLEEITIPSTVKKMGLGSLGEVMRVNFAGEELPEGLLPALRRGLNDYQPIECVIMSTGEKFYVPGRVDIRYINCPEHPMLAARDSDNLLKDRHFRQTLYKISVPGIRMFDCAYQAFKEDGLEETKRYLQGEAKNIIKYFADFDRFEDIIDFVDRGLCKGEDLEFLYELSFEVSKPEMAALAMDMIGKRKDASFEV